MLTSEAIKMSVVSFGTGDVLSLQPAHFQSKVSFLIACTLLWKSLFKTERNLITAISDIVTLLFAPCI